MIQTVDFFTPIVDDPYMFGQIAAANAISDVYAMGGQPAVALNIVGFPNCLDPMVLGDILAGGADKVMESGAVLVGGHTIQDDEPKYGLCVSGFVHPDHIFKNFGSRPGDVLIVTKQIGSGIINTALKGGLASEESIKEAQTVMASLNKTAKEIACKFPVTACTDITGFGLLGHAFEMADASNVTMEIEVSSVPYIREAAKYARMGLVPAGSYANREFSLHSVQYENVADMYVDLLYDPQSSGGFLISLPKKYRDDIMDEFLRSGIDTKVAVIGEITEKQNYSIILN